MKNVESIYAKWQYKFIKITPYKNDEIVAQIKTKKGFGDKEFVEIFTESGLQEEIIKRRKANDITNEGAKALLKAFKEVRDYKHRKNISLSVSNPDTSWNLPKPMTFKQKFLGKLGELISMVFFMGLFLLMIFIVIWLFKSCG